MAARLRGAIQKRVRRAFIAHPGREFRTVELLCFCFPRVPAEGIKQKHRISIRRAADRVAYRVRREFPGGIVYRFPCASQRG